jgi:diguanylate cyclase (GGDEF)-like protein
MSGLSGRTDIKVGETSSGAAAEQAPLPSIRMSEHGAARRPRHVANQRPVTPDESRRPPLGIWVVYGVLGVCLLAYIVSQVIRDSNQASTLVDGWGVAAFELVASVLCLSRAAVARTQRLVPLILGLGLFSWSIGDVTLTALGGSPPTPSLADAFYLGFYPFTYAGVFLLARRQTQKFTATTWLDGAIAGVGAATICAEFALRGLSLGAGTAEVATNLAYPVGDLVLLTLVIAGSTVLPGRRKARWLLLATGYALNAVGDTANLFQSSTGGTHIGTVLNAVAWPTSILLVSLSVWLPEHRPDPLARDPLPGLAIPGVATIGALVVLALSSFVAGDRPAFGLAVLTLVLAAVRSGVSLVRLRELTEQRHGQAVTDQLTTLGNRRALFELLDALLAENEPAAVGVRRLAFLFVDLNRFKEVNDSFGHSVGDELLRQLGARLKGVLRSSDLLVRLGGDEFAACLTDADADYGATVARRISARLEEPFHLGNVKARIGASIGIAVVPQDATNAHDLLRCADLAMYRAKVERKDFAIYQEELDGHANRLGLVEELRIAIECEELELHYQPQVDLSSGEVIAVEALVRWRHPRLGYVPPLEFLPLAEDAELMDPLTILVLDQALAQCAAWHAEQRLVTVSINISTTNLLNPKFCREVERLLEQHGMLPESLVLEITETTAMEEIDQCRKAIQDLRNLGVGVSVDDFGAGFTSLAYLSSLAVNELKLDRSFINGLSASEGSRDLALIRSTISLAHALGLRVVAEGVEDQASLDLLTSFGCDVVQGYLISKPKPAGELALVRGVATRGRRAARPHQHGREAVWPELGGQWGIDPLPSSSNP